MTSVAQKIKNRIKGKGRGWAFTPRDFVDLGTRNNVGQILNRLATQGFIRQVSRGVYDYPRKHPTMGDFPPHVKNVAAAVVRTTGDRLYPTGATAANMLGLTTQVPARDAYVTTGKPRIVQVWNLKVPLYKSDIPKTITRPLAYITLQALDNLGPRMADQRIIDKVAKKLSPSDKKDIQKNLRYIKNPWLSDIAAQLVAWEKPLWVPDPDFFEPQHFN
jgi:hypothetical protein